ncbi:MAG: hypothetical protein R2712_31130, partial [Vicinamibacterales bacterium]
RSANVRQTLDWPDDRDTPAAIAALVNDAQARQNTEREARLGVDWMFYPVARYYADRAGVPISVHVVDQDAWTGSDYLFVRGGSAAAAGATPVARFPATRSVLVRTTDR